MKYQIEDEAIFTKNDIPLADSLKAVVERACVNSEEYEQFKARNIEHIRASAAEGRVGCALYVNDEGVDEAMILALADELQDCGYAVHIGEVIGRTVVRANWSGWFDGEFEL